MDPGFLSSLVSVPTPSAARVAVRRALASSALLRRRREMRIAFAASVFVSIFLTLAAPISAQEVFTSDSVIVRLRSAPGIARVLPVPARVIVVDEGSEIGDVLSEYLSHEVCVVEIGRRPHRGKGGAAKRSRR
jgi:hypothetical protein